MPEETKPHYKKHRGLAVARLGIYRSQMEALVASKPDNKTLTQWVNDLLLEVLNEQR